MRLLFVVALVLGVSGSALAQSPTTPTVELRYVTACMKENTDRYCRCEFEAVKQKVKDPKDLEFLAQLEEETAGKTDDEAVAIVQKLPEDRQRWLIALAPEIDEASKSCPDYKEKK